MNTLENQLVTKSETNTVTKVVIIILNALCGVTIYCLLALRGIRAENELHDLCGMLAGLFVAIALVTWVAWPAKK
jgi:hypothetical protein